MVKLRITLIVFLLSAAVGKMNAWRMVIDKDCVKAVAANTASQKLVEGQHNVRLDSIAERKEKLALYTSSMAAIKEVYKLTMENVSGFGTESAYYKEIGTCAYEIVRDVPSLISTISKAKFTNKVMCITELSSLVLETQQLVGTFVNVVNNAKVENPLKGQSTTESTGDGYNMLDRYQRLSLAHSIYADLMKIRYKIDGMMMMAQYATLNDLFFKIDPESWASAMAMGNGARFLSMEWKRLHGTVITE